MPNLAENMLIVRPFATGLLDLSRPIWVSKCHHGAFLAMEASNYFTPPGRFDILSFGFDGPEDEKGMLETVSSINALISTELSSTEVDASRIILGGFSQGGAMSLLTGLSNERKLAGVAVLSGWLPLKDKFKGVSSHLF